MTNRWDSLGHHEQVVRPARSGVAIDPVPGQVDPAAASRRPAFDHVRLAAALSVAADTAYEGRDLPFTEFDFADYFVEHLLGMEPPSEYTITGPGG